jgi:hypothetical protein
MRTAKVALTIIVMILCLGIASSTATALDFGGYVEIEKGGYHAVPFTVQDSGIYKFSIESIDEHSIAVLVLDTANFQRYESNQTFEYEDYTVAISEDRQIALMAGEYNFVIDNSDRISPSPDADVEVRYSLYEEFPFEDLIQNIVLISVLSLVIIVVVIVTLLYFLRKDERKREEELRTNLSRGTKYCMHCGQRIPSESKVCPYCGGKN